MKRRHARSWLRSVFSRLTLAFTRVDVASMASLEESKDAKPAETYRARPAAEIIKRAGKIETYEEAGDKLMAFAPKGWHREESFAAARPAFRLDGSLKPSARSQRPVFSDVGKFEGDK